jgi:uncharacterized RDD family membrane protein YckC
VAINDRLYCVMCKSEQLLDVRSGIDRTQLNLAGIGRRFGALMIDRIIVIGPVYALFLIGMFATADAKGDPNPWVLLLLVPLVFAPPVYEGLMLQHKQGQTLGKMALRIRVVRVDGSPITAGQAWGRATMRFVLEGCASFIVYIPAFFTKEKTGLHDLVSSTRVVEII